MKYFVRSTSALYMYRGKMGLYTQHARCYLLSYPGCQNTLILILDARMPSFLSWMSDTTNHILDVRTSLILDVKYHVLFWMPDTTFSLILDARYYQSTDTFDVRCHPHSYPRYQMSPPFIFWIPDVTPIHILDTRHHPHSYLGHQMPLSYLSWIPDTTILSGAILIILDARYYLHSYPGCQMSLIFIPPVLSWMLDATLILIPILGTRWHHPQSYSGC